MILMGGAALEKLYSLPSIVDVKEYCADEDINEDGYRRVELDAKYRVHKGVDVDYTTPLDTICYIIHKHDWRLLVDAVLCNRFVKCKSIRKRYKTLYGVNVPINIDLYVRNILYSNVTEYVRQKHYKYSDFLKELPELCAKLNCTPDTLEENIKQLI